MHYLAYEAHSHVMKPVRSWAQLALPAFMPSGMGRSVPLRNLRAAYELIARAGLSHERPAFGIATVKVGNRDIAVREEAAHVTPFGTLLRFAKDVDTAQPRVLLVAPLSGHFATLLRATVETLLPEHDVYITDWHNARDVDRKHGRFGFDEYVEHLIRLLEAMGPVAHVIAVCQPCGQTVAAHELCTGLRPYLKRHHLQPGVGHYGVFSGKRWQNQVYPILRNLILASE